MAGPGRDALKAMTRLVRIMAVLEDAGTVGVHRDRLFEIAEYGEADGVSTSTMSIVRDRSPCSRRFNAGRSKTSWRHSR